MPAGRETGGGGGILLVCVRSVGGGGEEEGVPGDEGEKWYLRAQWKVGTKVAVTPE